MSSDVLRFGSVEVTEPRLQMDSLGDDFVAKTSEAVEELFLFFFCELCLG